MMHWFVGTSLQFRPLMAVLAAALLVLGAARLRDTPVDVLPEFAPPYVEVQTEALGLSAAEVEQLISLNIEELLSGVPWVQTVRSTSVPGLSSVILIFEPGTNLLRARQLVQERLTLAHMLPNVSKPPVILQPLSATSRVLMVGMTSRQVPPIEMSVLARWKIRPALMGVPGVANVAIWGQRERQLQVRVDPERLRAQHVSLDQVVSTTGNSLWVSPLTFLNASTPGTGGWIDTPQQRLEVRHVLPISSAADLARVTMEGAPLRLGDVAQVVEDHQPLIGDAVLGAPGLLFVVEKFPGANTLQVTRGVEAVLSELRPGLSGIQVDAAVFRPATFIELALQNLSRAVLIGAGLLLLVLLALLSSWRAALVSLVAIALSLVTAGLVLAWRGETLNVMVLAGLLVALTVLVDDAVGDVQNIQRRLDKRPPGQAVFTTVRRAALETRHTGGFAVAVLIVVIAPLFFLQGVVGAFYAPLAWSYALALLASLAVALTVTPALGTLLLRGGAHRESPLLRALQRGYARALERALGAPRRTWLAGGVVALAGVLALPFLRGTTLLPSFREPEVLVDWQGPPGQSLPAMTRLTAQVGTELRAVPGVTGFGAHVGRAVLSDQVVGVNAAQLWVRVRPGANYDRTLAGIQGTVDGYPGLTHHFGGYLQQTLRQVLTGSTEDLVVRLFGPQFNVLVAKAGEIRTLLARIPGVADVQLERQIQEPSLQIEVDLAKAERYGIKPGDVRRAAATLMNGLEVGSLFEQQKVFEVVVWSTPNTRRSLTDLRELLIDTPRGGHVRLQDVADVRVAPTLASIHREAVSRRLDVSLNVRGRDPGAVLRDVQSALAHVSFPLEYHAVVLGEYAERGAAQRLLLTAGLVALVTVFFLLQAALQNWRVAALLCLTLPLAVGGGVLAALVVMGPALSLGLLLGLLAALGLALRNAVVLIDHYRHLERTGDLGPALVLRGAQDRFAPILTSALALALALLPFALGGNRPGLEVGHPLAVAALGALVTTTLFSLFVLPSLYLRFGDRRAPDLGLQGNARDA